MSRPHNLASLVDVFFLALLSCILVAVISKRLWHATDINNCYALLEKGEWRDRARSPGAHGPFHNWQTPSCMTYEYKSKDLYTCLKRRRLIFIGDSTIRQIFWAVAEQINQKKAEAEEPKGSEPYRKHGDIEFYTNSTSLLFFWDPWLNSSTLERELLALSSSSVTLHPEDKNVGQSGNLLVMGAPGLWNARYGSIDYLKAFQKGIDGVLNHYPGRLTRQSQSAGMTFFTDHSSHMALLVPILQPWYPKLSLSRSRMITTEKIDRMQDYLLEASERHSAEVIWAFKSMVDGTPEAYDESGLHVVESVARAQAQLLMNLRCNNHAIKTIGSYQRTCCSHYPPPTWLQLLYLAVLPLLALSRVIRYRKRSLKAYDIITTEVMRASLVFAVALCMCYLTDRTHLFTKSNKYFQREHLLGACAFAGVIWVASFTVYRHDAYSKDSVSCKDRKAVSCILSRYQTEEWKGWMQLIILAYHYTGGSQSLWAYKLARVLVSSYLFMTGYGHTLYFLRTNDYSVKRVVKVLIRLNILSCALPYMMGTNYLFYYFAPLVSFWFLVTYTTLLCKRNENAKLSIISCKVGIATFFVLTFTKTPYLLEIAFKSLEALCSITWDATEWRFRLSLDLFIVPIGILFGTIHHDYLDRIEHGKGPHAFIKFLTPVQVNRKYRTMIVVSLAIIALVAFFICARALPTKYQYNVYHSYISIIPILSFIALRNCCKTLRENHAPIFAWFGRFSLETYVLQYHIWLAGDTKGLLRLGLLGNTHRLSEITEIVVITAMFIWISLKVSIATDSVTVRLVDDKSDERDMPYRRESLHGEIGFAIPKNKKGKGNGFTDFPLAGWRNWRLDAGAKLFLIILTMWILNVLSS